jgi:hypothetical protein
VAGLSLTGYFEGIAILLPLMQIGIITLQNASVGSDL